MKQINKKHRWLACLLAIIMLIGVVEPLGVVRAESAINTGALELTSAYANGTSAYSDACVEFKSTTAMTLSTGYLTADGGDVLCNGTSISGNYKIRVSNASGTFVIDSIAAPKVTDTITVQGQFKYEDTNITAKIEFPATTFQYMGLNASNKGYWRIYTETVSSGALVLDSTSMDGTDSSSWGRVLFTTSNGYCPAPTGLRQLVSEGGTIQEKTSSEGKFVDITSNASVKLFAGSPDSSLKYKYSFEPGWPYTSGTIYTIEGKFKTEDGFSVNFPKTAIKRENVDGMHKWSYYYAEVISTGALDVTDGYKYGNGYSDLMLEFKAMKDITWPITSTTSLTAVQGSGEIIYGGTDVTGKANFKAMGTKGVFQIDGLQNTNVGWPKDSVVLTVKGQFKLSDDYAMEFPETTFKYMGKNGNGKGYWRVLSEPLTENYVNSGAVTVHSNSSSSNTLKQFFYFETEDRSLPRGTDNEEYLRPESGRARITYQGPNDDDQEVDLTFNGRIFSHSNGAYALYILCNQVHGAVVNLQGKFATADGSIGIDIQPVTFQYVAVDETNGYWVTVGASFTSDIYWEAENAYEEEILAYEATVRLPQNVTENGGVILGTNRDGDDTYAFGVDADGAPYLALKDNGTSVEYRFTNINVCTGNWVTIKIVRNGTTVEYYEDGIKKDTLDTQTELSANPTAKATVGGDYTTKNANYFKGSIKDVTVYADVACEQKIASYDMSVVTSSTKTLVDGSDNEGYDITRTLRWLEPNEVPELSNYAYSFAVIGDTQAINDKNGNKNNGPLEKVYDYICDNVSTKNIKFAFGLGDITENDDASEWERAKAQIQKLDGVVPYNLNRGNHDSSAMMNQYFTYTDYKDKVSGAADKAIENTCQFLTVGQVDYLIFSLDFGPSDDVLNWAASIIETHPNHNVIITTHSYLTRDAQYTNSDNDTSLAGAPNTGQDIWDKLVSQHKNIVMVLSGHVYANDIIVKEVTGKYGNTIKEIVVNPQVADAMTDGGTGMVAMLYFSEDGKNVQVRYYSTVRNQYLADTNQFSMDLNVVQHVDAVTVEPYEYAKFIKYRTEGAYTAPTKEGYLFAGWFTDEACKNPLVDGVAVDETKTYYAKFVDKYAQVVKRQIRESKSDSKKLDLRLVTTLDSLDYKEVGFIVDFGDDIPILTHPFTKAYKTLHGADILYHPNIFSAASKYFATLLITNIPVETLGAERIVTVTTYWVTYDGTTVTSAPDEKMLKPTGY